MTGVQVVLGAFAGAALAVAITILRGWLVNRFAGPWPADPAHTFAAQMSTQRQCRGEHRGMSTPRVPLRADVLEAERRAVQHSRARPERTDPTP